MSPDRRGNTPPSPTRSAIGALRLGFQHGQARLKHAHPLLQFQPQVAAGARVAENLDQDDPKELVDLVMAALQILNRLVRPVAAVARDGLPEIAKPLLRHPTADPQPRHRRAGSNCSTSSGPHAAVSHARHVGQQMRRRRPHRLGAKANDNLEGDRVRLKQIDQLGRREARHRIRIERCRGAGRQINRPGIGGDRGRVDQQQGAARHAVAHVERIAEQRSAGRRGRPGGRGHAEAQGRIDAGNPGRLRGGTRDHGIEHDPEVRLQRHPGGNRRRDAGRDELIHKLRIDGTRGGRGQLPTKSAGLPRASR